MGERDYDMVPGRGGRNDEQRGAYGYKNPRKPDPLLQSLEALAAVGALENDLVLQEYVSSCVLNLFIWSGRL